MGFLVLKTTRHPALPPLPIWISAQLCLGCRSFSLNPVCASHFSLCLVSSHCALLWWECLHLLGNLKGNESFLLDAPGAVLSSGWACLFSESKCSNPDQPSGSLLTLYVEGPKTCAQYSKCNVKNAFLKGVIPSLDLLTVLLILAAQDCYITSCAARTCCWLAFSCLSFMALEAFQKMDSTGIDLLEDSGALFKSPYVFIAHVDNWLNVSLKEAL